MRIAILYEKDKSDHMKLIQAFDSLPAAIQWIRDKRDAVVIDMVNGDARDVVQAVSRWQEWQKSEEEKERRKAKSLREK
jgi:hypothetical protein